MRSFTRILLVLGFFLFNNCGKRVEKVHKDMVGYWRTNNTTLEIKGDGKAYWGRLTNSEEESIHGRARIKKGKLIISGGGIRKEVTINEYPYSEQANYTEYNTVMVLNNEKFTKTPGISIDDTWRCSNGIKDGNETETDCGGGTCNECPTCSDQLKNQNETGVDCGGNCAPCQEGSCSNTFAANVIDLLACTGNSFHQHFSSPDVAMTDSVNRFVVKNSYGQWDISIVLPQLPPGSLVYRLSDSYNSVDETSDYDAASIQVKHNFGSSTDVCFSSAGNLYVTVAGSQLTFVFCDISFNSQQFGCFKASGKFVR